jgi:MFS family permease
MPILFYAPWVIFGTLAGYFADRFSKQRSLVFWKVAEVAITLVTLAGFWLGTERNNSWGPWLVLSTVFLMGLHSTFFVPAKYGVMPEVLPPQLLSRGNGLLESLSFLAVILGTVSGGVLSYQFKGDEYLIGLILVGLALAGALASLLIERMPAANPARPFPRSIYGPLFGNLRTMVRSRPLGLAVLGIAFFTFVVVFMRASVYMHGESQVERWTELKTSIVVGMTALGIGLGSPLAGYLSGGKVEVGLIPLGALGMVLAALLASVAIGHDWLGGLIAGLILIGFFTGFYIVPMFTLLQHRAPKTSKGDLVATNNLISVTGAIAATVIFFGLEKAAEKFHIAEPVAQQKVATGRLVQLVYKDGRPRSLEVEGLGGGRVAVPDGDGQEIHVSKKEWKLGLNLKHLETGDEVDVGSYRIGPVTYFTVRPHSGEPLPPAYNKSHVPRYLFLGAAAMTLFTLLLLRWRLPDLVLRSLLWLRSLGRYRLRVEGVQNLPADGPVILATNCRSTEGCLQVLAVTDRYTCFVLNNNPGEVRLPLALRHFLTLSRLATLGPDGDGRAEAMARAERALGKGWVVGVPADANGGGPGRFLDELARRSGAVLLPVYCDGDEPDPQRNGRPRRGSDVRVVIGAPLPPGTPADIVREEVCRLADGSGREGAARAAVAASPLPCGERGRG